MKNTASALNTAVLTLLFSASLFVGCSDGNKSVSLRNASPAPGNNTPGEKPGSPAPTPTPAEPTPGTPGEEPTPAPTATPQPAPSRVARFICEGETNNSRSFNTLNSEAVSNYQMPSLVPYISGQPLKYSKSPVPLQSNGEVVTFIMRGQEDDFTPWKIYKATGNILDSRANLQVLSSFAGTPPKGGFAYENLKLGREILSANLKRTAYLYPTADGTYTWESLATGKNFSVPFNANTSFNPTFIGGDDSPYLRFDQERDGLGVLTQKFYHFDSKKIISLPAPADGRDSQLFGHVNGSQTTLYWVEGRPNGVWKIRALNLNSPSTAFTVGTVPGNPAAIRLPMTFIDTPSTTLLAYAEEEVGVDKSGRSFFQTAALHLVSASAKLVKITADTTVPYSDELKNTALNAAAMNGGILGGVFFEPISGRLFSTVLSAGGLASYNLNSRTWRTHGMIARTFGCFNPQWGVEVTHE